jgi:hypothetical protein
MSAAASLAGLRDIAVPPEPSLWPPAPGVWILLVAVILLAASTGWIIWRHWRRTAYRRAGLVLLADVSSIHGVSVILKRVALAAWPRHEVASLHGRDWVAFLERTCPATDLSGLATGDPSSIPDPKLRGAASDWIRHHRTGSRENKGGIR